MLIFLLIPVVVAVVIYLYLIWPHSHWKDRGINGPKPQILVGNFPLTLWYKQNLDLDLNRLYNQYKGKERFIGVFFGRQLQLIMLDHKLVLDTMVTNFKHFYANDIQNWFDAHPMIAQNPLFSSGPSWKKRRAEQVPSLTTAKLKNYFPLMQQTAKKLHPYIEKTIKKNPKDGFDAKDLAQRFTAENMANCLYGIEAQAFTDNSPIRESISDLMNTIFNFGNRYFTSRMYPIFREIVGAPRLPKYLVDFFHNLMRDAVDVRRESRTDRPDILNYFLALQTKKNLSHTDLVAHSLTYFGDGTESSSIGLANIVFLLAKHQDVQDRLRSEIKEAMSQKEVLEYDDIMNMPYLEQVINEAMRLFPIAVLFTRICTAPLEVENYDGRKSLIQKGDLIVFPIKNIHYDEEFYPKPMEFNPDRFSPELGGSKKYKDMGVYYPFGNGPRQCLGYRLALLQLKIFLIELLAHWKAHLNPRTQRQIEMDPVSFLLMQKGGVWVDLERVSINPREFKGKETFVGTYFAREPQLLITDRELVRDVYVKNFKNFHDNDSAKWFEMDPIIAQNPFFLTGEEWRAKRAEVTPALSVSKLKAMNPVMQVTARKITPFIEQKMNQKPKDGLDAKDICQRFTTENMTNCLYGVEAAAFTDNSPIRDNIRKLMDKVLSLINYYFMCTMFPFVTKFMKKPGFPKPIIKFFVDLMEDALEARRSSKVERFGILSYLLSVQEKKDLSDIALVGHALTFFTDGTETSSVALANTLFFLARHPDTQKKLREEINQSLTNHESIRLFPPVALSTRVCTEPIELEDSKDKKVFIKKDDSVILPVFSIHHDEEYFNDAWEFNPDRFSPELGGIKKYRDMGAFYPFGDGPRQCLGMKLAMAQMKACLIEIVRNWELHLNPKTRKDIAVSSSAFLLMQEGGIWIDFKRIK